MNINPTAALPLAKSLSEELEAQLHILATADPDNFTRIDPDPMTDELHATCDAEFLAEDANESTESVFGNQFASIAQCIYLLDSLAQSPSCKPYLKQTATLYSDLKTIIRKLDRDSRQALKDICRVVVAQGEDASFRELRRFKCLIQPRVWSHAMDSAAATAADAKFTLEYDAARQAWMAPARGDYHHLLHKAINAMAKSRDAPYGNILPVIQSSGTGKSRTAYDLGALVFTLPLNIDSGLSRLEIKFPLVDTQIRDYLTNLRLDTPAGAKDQYAAFLHALFDVAATRLQEDLEPGKTYWSLADLALAWRQYLEIPQDGSQPVPRHTLYRDVVTMASKGIPPHVECLAGADSSFDRLETAIRNRIKSVLPEDGVLVVVSIENLHTLHDIKLSHPSPDPRAEPSRRTAYDSFWAAWVDLTERRSVFALSLSTQPHVLHVYPRTPLWKPSPSGRGRGVEAVHHTPWCKLPFDLFQVPKGEPIFRAGEHTAHEVTQDDCMALFGRPIFSSRIRNAPEGGAIRSKIVEFALFKLMGHTVESLTEAVRGPGDTSLSTTVKLVPLAVRILLDLDSSLPAARDIEENMVASHLRTVFSIPGDELPMRSGYPSEPLVAKAAAIAMNIIAPHSHPIDIVAQELRSGLIARNAHAELVARLLLTLAHDRAALSMTRSEDTTTNWDPLIPVSTFLKSLFSKDVAEKMMACTSNNPDTPAQTLAETFKDGYVRFSHFVTMADCARVDTHLGLAGFARGFAIQAALGSQRSFDIAVPVVMTAGKFTEADMTFIIFQVKNRTRPSRLSLANLAATAPGFFDAENEQPYIAIGIDLGVEEPPGDSLVEVATKPLRAASLRQAAVRHPCYGFTVSGLSRRIYRVVESTKHEHKLTGILRKSRSLLDAHSRQQEDVLSEVRRLKYSWARNGEVFDWVRDPKLFDL